jgi:HEAT repeat protein
MLAAFLILFAGVAAWLLLQPGEPVYEGRPLSYWLATYADFAPYDRQKREKAEEAVRHAGTNAVPTLLRILQASDSDLKYKVNEWASKQHIIKIKRISAANRYNEALSGFEILGPKAKVAVPALMDIYERNYSRSSQNIVLMVLMTIGPGAAEAVPMLAKQTNNPNAFNRLDATFALGVIHSSSDHLAVSALIQFLHDADPAVRRNAANALWHFSDAEASRAIPTMVEALKDPDRYVRESAARLIRRLDPKTAIKEGIN